MGRPRKPVEQKKLEGTYRKDRDAEVEKLELQFSQDKKVIFSKDTILEVPQCIQTEYCKTYYKDLTAMLISIQMLSPADLPQVEQLCVVLEKLIEVQAVYVKSTPFDEDYEKYQKLYLKLLQQYDSLGSKYYISPQARSKLTLDVLNVAKTKKEVEKQDTAIDQLLRVRQ